MTGDQRLIVKLEDVLEKLDANELLAAFHLLDEVLKDLEGASKQAGAARLVRSPASVMARPPAAAAG